MPTLHRHLPLAFLVLAACSSAAMPEVTGDAGPPLQPDAMTASADVMVPQGSNSDFAVTRFWR
jgi:hypothetical protein